MEGIEPDIEQVITEIIKIAEVIDDTDTTYETARGDVECVFCDGEYSYKADGGYIHKESCVKGRVRKVLEQVQE